MASAGKDGTDSRGVGYHEKGGGFDLLIDGVSC